MSSTFSCRQKRCVFHLYPWRTWIGIFVISQRQGAKNGENSVGKRGRVWESGIIWLFFPNFLRIQSIKSLAQECRHLVVLWEMRGFQYFCTRDMIDIPIFCVKKIWYSTIFLILERDTKKNTPHPGIPSNLSGFRLWPWWGLWMRTFSTPLPLPNWWSRWWGKNRWT